MANCALLGELPTWGLGGAAGWGAPEESIDSTEAGSIDEDESLRWLSIVHIVFRVNCEASCGKNGKMVVLCVIIKSCRCQMSETEDCEIALPLILC